MRRVSFVVAAMLALGTASAARAQGLVVGPYAQFQTGFTVGSTVGALFGGEAGFSANTFDLYFEGGKMLNTRSSEMDAAAATIAASLGATYEASQPTNYFDIGFWYKLPTTGNISRTRASAWAAPASRGRRSFSTPPAKTLRATSCRWASSSAAICRAANGDFCLPSAAAPGLA